MKREFRKILIFAFLLILTLAGINIYIQHLLVKYPLGNIAKVNDVMEHNLDAEITIWGASTARVHFDAVMISEKLDTECINVGLDGTPFHQYSGLLNEYIDYSYRGRVLVISIDVNGLGRRNALFQSYAWLHHIDNDHIYAALKSVDYDLAVKSRYVPFYYFTALDRRFLVRCLKWVYLGTDGESELANNGYHPIQGTWRGVQHRPYSEPFNVEIDSSVVNGIRNTIIEAEKKHMLVLIVVPPCYTEASKLILNLHEFQHAINSLKMENAFVLNYLDDPISEVKSNFSNYTHLNADGASLFTEKFSTDLQSLLERLRLVI